MQRRNPSSSESRLLLSALFTKPVLINGEGTPSCTQMSYKLEFPIRLTNDPELSATRPSLVLVLKQAKAHPDVEKQASSERYHDEQVLTG